MNPECPRCSLKAIAKTADGKEWTCEAGHFWSDGEQRDPPPADPVFVSAYAQHVANGLTNHLRAAAREYLERLVKELGG